MKQFLTKNNRAILLVLSLIFISLIWPFSIVAADELAPAPVVSSEGSYAWGLGARRANLSPGIKTAPKIALPELNAATGPASSLPAKIDYSAFVPPVGNQGGQGSCVGWAVGYYYKTIQEYRERNWSLTVPAHQFSPSFVYNQINGGADNGSWPSDAFDLLKNTGNVSIADFPYVLSDYRTKPGVSLFSAANQYRAKSWAYLFYNSGVIPGKSPNPPATIDTLRQYLALGDVFVLTLPVYDTWDNVGHTPTSVATTPTNSLSYRGDHEITVVGYDDTISSKDGLGAFRIVNQWGTYWGDGGYTWLSYKFVADYGWDATAMTDLIQPAVTPLSYAKDGNPVLNYSPNWTHPSDSSSQSGTIAQSTNVGDSLDFSFYGTSLAWIGPLSQQAGVTDVYIDGVFQQRVDQWREGETKTRSLIYYRGDLPLANHKLRLVTQGALIEHCPGNWSCTAIPTRPVTLVDAMVVNQDYVDDSSPTLTYSYGWKTIPSSNSLSSTETRSATAGATLTYKFSGSAISWFGITRPEGGRADVYLDNALVASLELYSISTRSGQLLFSQGNLSASNHTLQIIVRPDRHSQALDNLVSLDYLVALA